MRTVKQILLALSMAAALAAQSITPPSAPPEPPRLHRVFLLKYADAQHVAGLLNAFGYGINADRNLHSLAVTAPAEGIAAVEDAIKKLDVPAAAARDIDLIVYLVVASEQSGAGAELPAELQPVATQMKKIFAYKGFRLLDSIELRTQPGNRASADGVVGDRSNYHFEAQPTDITEDPQGRVIRLDNLRLDLRLPNDHSAGIRTEITVREGQKAVVGKSNIGAGESLILVITAKVVE